MATSISGRVNLDRASDKDLAEIRKVKSETEKFGFETISQSGNVTATLTWSTLDGMRLAMSLVEKLLVIH